MRVWRFSVVTAHQPRRVAHGTTRRYHSSRKNRVLVFALYKKEAARVEQDVKRAGYSGIAIHGDMTQVARTQALQQFKDGTVPLLIATDVAARGLDIPDVEVVIKSVARIQQHSAPQASRHLATCPPCRPMP